MHFSRKAASTIFAITVSCSAFAADPPAAVRADAITRLTSVAAVEPAMNPVTGMVRQARFQPGNVVSDGNTMEEKGELFLLRHGAAFGIDAPAIELEQIRTRVDRLGHTHFIYDQIHRGVPVFGGRMGLHFDDAGELIAANSSLVPVSGVKRVSPEIDAVQARERARLLVAKQKKVDHLGLDVTTAELVVFHDGVIWGRQGDTHLAWQLEVTDGAGIREQLFVDSGDGRLLQQISGIEHITRIIYENNGSNIVWQEGDPLPYEGSGPFRDDEINNLISVAEQTYNTFANISGGSFISWTGDDASMQSYYDRDGMDCPNAYFNGSSTSFCVGSATDDVVAHEWTHGYTQETHGLVYAWQSGALNESYSDVFGELVDLLYDSGTDAPSTVRAAGTCSAATAIDEVEFVVEAPASIAGPMDVNSATFNPAPPWDVSGTVALADDGVGVGNDACDPLVDFEAGKIALITMMNCSERFLTPVTNAEAAGAIAAIVVNPLNDNLTTMTGSGGLSIPAVFLGRSDGDILRAAIADGVEVSLRSGGDGSLRWLIAEDSSAFGGAIRDMWNPECLGDPGSVFSSNYYCSDGDNGGVHSNSGIPNHAFAMLVDGGSANGIAVPAIGPTRAAQIYWRAMSIYQFPLSDFRDHAEILATSCQDLLGAPLPDLLTGEVSGEVITAADCSAVDAAMLATQMRDWPSQCNFSTILDPDAPFVPGEIDVFSETFDAEPAMWNLGNEGVFAEYEPRDWIWTEDVPEGGTGGAFYAMDNPEVGNCQAGSDDQSGVVHLDSPSIVLPMGTRPLLTFDHFVATEDRVDGGNLKISVNGGAFELVPGDAFVFNPYNDELRAPQWNDNPLAGEEAFVGTNATTYRGSWGQSQVDLGGQARGGDTIVLRFDFGTDGCNGQDGWYVDNVRLVMQPRERQGGTRTSVSP
jgi:Zn-dependent metalloprotease